jgi:hypothetical protein
VDLHAIIFNPISSTILKWLRFKVVSWRHDFQPCTAMIWDCFIAALLLFSVVTMATKLYAAVISVKLSSIELNEVKEVHLN